MLGFLTEREKRRSANKGLWLSTKENKMEESVWSLLSNPKKWKKTKKRNQFYTSRNLNTSQYWLKSIRITRNGPKFCPRWNKEVSYSSLLTNTVFSSRSDRNRTKFKTMSLTRGFRHFNLGCILR